MMDQSTPPVDAQTSESSAPEPQQTQRRGPGRPRKDGQPPQSSAKRPTTPPKAPKASSREEAKPIDEAQLAKQLVGVHVMLAMMTKCPELAISESEASQLSHALAQVAAQYDLVVNPKVVAGVQLFAVAAMIYAPRIPRIKASLSARNQQKKPDLHVVKPTPASPDTDGRAG